MRRKWYESSGGVVLDEHGRILLLERDVPREEGVRHEIRLPKGHIDPGESAEEAALREVCEESGYCDLDILAPLGENDVTYTFRGEEVTRHEHYFLMRLKSEQNQGQRAVPNSEEELFKVRWAESLEEAATLLTYEGERVFIERAFTALELLQQEQ